MVSATALASATEHEIQLLIKNTQGRCLINTRDKTQSIPQKTKHSFTSHLSDKNALTNKENASNLH